MRFFHLRVLKKLNEHHIRLLAKTPFLHFFGFPKGTEVNNAILHQILLMWDGKGSFIFKTGSGASTTAHSLKFTADEVALVMGLSTEGKPVQYKRECVTVYGLRTRHFGRGTGEITRRELEDAIVKAVDDTSLCSEINNKVADVVRLLVLYLFTTILFPQSTGNVPIHMFDVAENLKKLKFLNWSESVHQMLMDNIPHNAAWCKLKKDGEEVVVESSQEEVSKKKKKPKKASGTMPGCALALIVSHRNFYSNLIIILSVNHQMKYMGKYLACLF